MPHRPDNHYHPALTGVRAIAAWMVFIHHFIPFNATSNPLLHNLAFTFHIGVSVFFVLSGFLIFYRYRSVTKEKGWVGMYLRNRFARIFPLLFLLTLLTYCVAGPGIDGGPELLIAFLLNITLLNGYSDSLKFMGISQAWTLTVEETFYLLAPLIMLVRSKSQLLGVPVVALMVGFLLVFISKGSQYFFGTDHYM
jgi:peptidoglycan/LPS O-acetylase OafA/YrhL